PAPPLADGPSSTTAFRRVARNAVIPTAASVVNRGLDFGFAIFMLRTLGPTEVGRYTWAVLVIGYLDILISFGLGVLMTRDISRDPSVADRYLGGALVARAALWLTAVGAALVLAGPAAGILGINHEMGLTVA